jgi:CRP-like cAMP-binding protein
VRIRAVKESELIEIEREALQALVETDSELSDIFLRAFIHRRLEIDRRVSDAADLIAAILKLRPDVVVLDLRMLKCQRT